MVLEIEYIPISEIIPYDKNPRKNDQAVDIVAKSIKEFGFKVPIILDKNNVIIAGHTRVKAAIKLGLTEVPVIWADDLTEEQVKAFRLMDNKSIEYASWDWDLLKEELKGLQTINFDLNLTGFDEAELNQLIKLGRDDEFNVNKELEEAMNRKSELCKEGDIWQLGEHKLIIGDCTKKENWEKLLNNEKWDFMFTDPPYRLAYTKNQRFKGYVKTKKGFGFRGQHYYLGVEKRGGVPEYNEWLSIAKDYQNPQGFNIIIYENWKNCKDLWIAMEKYWKIHNMIIWHCAGRTQGFSRKGLFYNKYDIALFAGEKELNEEFEQEFEDYLKENEERFFNTYQIGIYAAQKDFAFNREKKIDTLKVTDHISWNVDYNNPQGLIFGTKPIPILIPYMKLLSNQGEIIIEPFAGAGSTLIACEILNRKCRAIEIEPLYAEIIIKRWEKLTNKIAVKL